MILVFYKEKHVTLFSYFRCSFRDGMVCLSFAIGKYRLQNNSHYTTCCKRTIEMTQRRYISGHHHRYRDVGIKLLIRIQVCKLFVINMLYSLHLKKINFILYHVCEKANRKMVQSHRLPT